jgi:SOS response regulatory protein OraA/RecX
VALLSDIRVTQRGSRRRQLVLDGDPWRTTSVDVVRALALTVGAIAPIDEFTARLDGAEPRSARERALRLLAYRERSSSQLRTQLATDGYPEDVAADVVADLMHARLVDDERYAASLSRTLATVRGLGRSRVMRDLQSAGIAPDAALAALDQVLSEEAEAKSALALARALANRPGANVQRVAARLVRKGFSTSLALRTARESLSAAADDDTASDLPVPDP